MIERHSVETIDYQVNGVSFQLIVSSDWNKYYVTIVLNSRQIYPEYSITFEKSLTDSDISGNEGYASLVECAKKDILTYILPRLKS